MKGRRSRSVCDALFSPSRSVLARADKVISAARGKADSLRSMGIFPSLTHLGSRAAKFAVLR
jgi:hypothetical protein